MKKIVFPKLRASVLAFLIVGASVQASAFDLDGKWAPETQQQSCEGSPTFLIAADRETVSFAGATGPIPGGSFWKIVDADESSLNLQGANASSARAILAKSGDLIRFTMKESDGEEIKEFLFRRCSTIEPQSPSLAPQQTVAPASVPLLQFEPAPVTLRPSFDCSKTLDVDEQTICQSPRLSSKDRELASLYSDLKANLGAASISRLKKEQRSWLKLRSSCGSDESCISTLYTSRIQTLQKMR